MRGEKGAKAEGERRGRRGDRVGEGETEMGEERRVERERNERERDERNGEERWREGDGG